MKNIIVLLLLAIPIVVPAQKNTNVWHFGNKGGINFNTMQSVTTSNQGVIDNVPIPVVGFFNTTEGCFTYSNKSTGELMISSDGMTVYNKNGTVMPNGSGLKGDPSSTSSGVLIPYPGDRSLFYVISVGATSAGNKTPGLYYSVIDMTLDGGLGGIDPLRKNVSLSFGTSGYSHPYAGENIGAVQHANGTDYWLLSRFRDVLLVWEVTSTGISEPTVYKGLYNIGTHYAQGLGYLKFNIEGTKFIHVDHNYQNNSVSRLTIGDFDRSTGIVSNLKERNSPELSNPYGLEFSVSGEYVYFSSIESLSYNGLIMAKMEDIENLSLTAFPVTRLMAGPSCIQMGSDGRIYGIAAGSRNIYIVLNPDSGDGKVATLTNYLISGTTGLYGLPVFAISFFNLAPVESKEVICAGINNAYKITVNLTGTASLSTLKWDFGDGTIITQNLPAGSTSGTYSYNHIYTSPGTYTVRVVPGIDDGDGVVYEDSDKTSEKSFDILDCSIVSNRMIRRNVNRQ